jgi:hypothetical protein
VLIYLIGVELLHYNDYKCINYQVNSIFKIIGNIKDNSNLLLAEGVLVNQYLFVAVAVVVVVTSYHWGRRCSVSSVQGSGVGWTSNDRG